MGMGITMTLAWIMIICSGLMAGVYLAFSSFIMRSFDALPASAAVAAMNAINTHIQRSAFMPLFFGSTVVAALLAGTGLWSTHNLNSVYAIASGSIYICGMFAVTAAFNVPLNNTLNRAEDSPLDIEALWADYRIRWTRWNTARTAACLISLALCIEIIR